MITRQDLRRWEAISDCREVNQGVIHAYELIRDSGYRLDPSIPFREFKAAVIDLAAKMASVISFGRDVEIRSQLFAQAIQVFDHSSMGADLEDFEDLFQLVVEDLRAQRDTRRWDVIALPKICEAFTRNLEFMSASTFARLLDLSSSFTVKQRECGPEHLEKKLFFGVASEIQDYTQVFNNLGLIALVNQGVGEGIETDTLGSSGSLDAALRTARTLEKINDAGISIRAWQLDALLAFQVLERLTQAHKACTAPDARLAIERGVRAMAGVFAISDGQKPSMRSNSFRPYLDPTNWKIWMDVEPMAFLTSKLSETVKSIDGSCGHELHEAVGRLKMRLLIDATMCAQSLAPPKTGKQTKSRIECAVSMANLIRDLVPSCEIPMGRPGALYGLNFQAKTVLVGLLPMGEVRKELLRANKRVKSQVLMDDLGM